MLLLYYYSGRENPINCPSPETLKLTKNFCDPNRLVLLLWAAQLHLAQQGLEDSHNRIREGGKGRVTQGR